MAVSGISLGCEVITIVGCLLVILQAGHVVLSKHRAIIIGRAFSDCLLDIDIAEQNLGTQRIKRIPASSEVCFPCQTVAALGIAVGYGNVAVPYGKYRLVEVMHGCRKLCSSSGAGGRFASQSANACSAFSLEAWFSS